MTKCRSDWGSRQEIANSHDVNEYVAWNAFLLPARHFHNLGSEYGTIRLGLTLHRLGTLATCFDQRNDSDWSSTQLSTRTWNTYVSIDDMPHMDREYHPSPRKRYGVCTYFSPAKLLPCVRHDDTRVTVIQDGRPHLCERTLLVYASLRREWDSQRRSKRQMRPDCGLWNCVSTWVWLFIYFPASSHLI